MMPHLFVSDHDVEGTGKASCCVSQFSSGFTPLHRQEIASARVGNVGRPRIRQVCRTGEDSLHPAIPRFTAGPLVTFAPQDAEAVGALRDVIRRFHTRDIEKHSQRLPFPCRNAEQTSLM